ncbi:MAG: hypothetical protein MJ105_07300 [Lachnospiraceae bacterium]|nr:hypothetical protein [Lachnospiraceae bacterium]
MLNPSNERLDYGEILSPPVGYDFNFAVATTYSLDFDALVGACLALGLSAETDSELLNNPVCLLEALRTTGDKIALFCENGQIHMPGKVSPLYILLEQMVYQVSNVKARKNTSYSSFHPKFWIIRYVDEKDMPLYRIIILSRNLTFDRSWDVSFYLDGIKEENPIYTEKNIPICDFLVFLSKNLGNTPLEKEKIRKIKKIIEELPYIHFRVADKEFSDFEFIPTGIPKSSGGEYSITDYPLFSGYEGNIKGTSQHEIFIMSPFLSGDVIRFFNNKKGTVRNSDYILVTRRESLSKLKKEDADNFKIFVMKDDVIDGESACEFSRQEEKLSESTLNGLENQVVFKQQDVHAKVFAYEKNLYLGSLNASHNAVCGNIEFMIKLEGDKNSLRAEKLFSEICGGELGGLECPFEPASLENIQDNSKEENNILDSEIKRLCRLNPSGKVVEKDKNYEIYLEMEDFESDYQMSIKPLLSENEDNNVVLAKEMVFKNLCKEQLSEFFVISVRDDKKMVQRVVKFCLGNLPEDREKAVISSVIKDDVCFFRYVSFLLGENMILSALESSEGDVSVYGEDGKKKVEMLTPLYEKMLKTALVAPRKLKEIDALMDAISEDGIIPDGFKELYATFREAVKENG